MVYRAVISSALTSVATERKADVWIDLGFIYKTCQNQVVCKAPLMQQRFLNLLKTVPHADGHAWLSYVDLRAHRQICRRTRQASSWQ